MAKQIGLRKNIFVGRMMENMKRSRGERPESSLDVRAGLPVSFRRRLVLRSRRTGAEVSDMRSMDVAVKAPAWILYEMGR